MRRRHQFVEDAATPFVSAVAARPQLQQLLLQRPHALEACPHSGQLLVHQQIHFAKVILWRIQIAQKLMNIGQWHVQHPAVANEGQALQMGRFVVAVTVVAPRRLGQKTPLFVVAKGFNIHARGAGKILDLHVDALSSNK